MCSCVSRAVSQMNEVYLSLADMKINKKKQLQNVVNDTDVWSMTMQNVEWKCMFILSGV